MAGNIKGITIEINGDTSKLGKALQDVEKRSKATTSSLRDIEKSLKFNPGNTELVAQQQRKLRDAISETKEKLTILADADRQAKAQLTNGELGQDQYDALQREIIKTENQLGLYEDRLLSSQSEQERFSDATDKMALLFEKSGTSVQDYADILGDDIVEAYEKGEGSSEQMEAALQSLGRELLGTGEDSETLNKDLERLGEGVSFEQLQNEARESGREFGELSHEADDSKKAIDKIEETSLSLTGLDALVDMFGQLKNAVGEAIGAIQEAWAELDAGQDTIIAKTGATGEALEGMNETFTDVYTSMPVEANNVGDAIGELNTQFGLQGDALDSATRQLLAYSELNGTEVTTSVQSAKKAMDQFGLSGSDLSHVLDVVNKAGQDTGVSTDSLMQSMAQGAPILQSLGLSFDESAVMLSKFEQSGVQSTRALSYMTKAQDTAAKKGKTLQEALSEFQTVATSSATETEKLEAASALFGAKGGAVMLKAAKDGKLNFSELASAAAGAKGSVIETYNATLDPADQATIAQNNFKTAMADLSSTIQTAIAPALQMLSDGIRAVCHWFVNLDPNVKIAIVAIAGIVTAFLGIVTVVATVKTALGILTPLLTNFKAIFSGIGTAFSSLGAFVAANPIVLIIAAIAVAVGLLIANWDTVKAKAKEVWDYVVEAWNGLKESVTQIFTAVGEFVSTTWDGIKNKIVEIATNIWNKLQEIWNGIQTSVTNSVNTIKSTVSNVFNAVRDNVSNVWNGVKTTVTNIVNGIQSTITNVWNNIQSTISNVVNGVRTTVTNVFESIKSTVTGIWNGIKSAITTPIESAKNIIGGIIDTIKGFFNFRFTWPHIPLPHFRFSGDINPFSGNFPPRLSINWYKNGGIFDRPSIIGVGEAGSEAVVPTNKLGRFFEEALNRAKRTDRAQSESGVVVNVQQVIVREESDIKKIADELYRLMEREKRARHV